MTLDLVVEGYEVASEQTLKLLQEIANKVDIEDKVGRSTREKSWKNSY